MQEGDCQDNEKFFSYVTEHAPKYGEEIMTLAQQLKQEGGLAIMQSSVLNMLKKGLTPVEIIDFTGFDKKEVIEIIKANTEDKDIKI